MRTIIYLLSVTLLLLVTLVKAEVAFARVVVQAPNGDEVWYTGHTYTIRWWSDRPIGRPRVTLKRGDRVLMFFYPARIGVDRTSGASFTAWTVPPALQGIGSGFRIRVENANGSEWDESDLPFTISRARGTLRVTSPVNGESIVVGNDKVIQWTSARIPENERMRITLRRHGQQVFTIADDVPNTGSFVWRVGVRRGPPVAGKPVPRLPHPIGTGFKIRVEPRRHGAWAENDGTFTIAMSRIAVTSPRGGESYRWCDNIPIRWNSEGLTGSVGIEMLKVGDPTCPRKAIASVPADRGSYSYKLFGRTCDDPLKGMNPKYCGALGNFRIRVWSGPVQGLSGQFEIRRR